MWSEKVGAAAAGGAVVGRDGYPDGAKNSHILPTGQWYAPSAVINDALIMH